MIDINLIIQLFVLALFLSLNNFLASIGMGFSKIWGASRIKVALIFGLLDLSMPLFGMGIGKWAGGLLGNVSIYFAPILLAALGLLLIYQGIKAGKSIPFPRPKYVSEKLLASIIGIAFIGFWFSVDNLFVGFSLGLLGTSLLLAVSIFGIVTFSMVLLGLIIGNKLRGGAEERVTNLAGKGRIITGIIFITLALWKFIEGAV